MTDVSATLRPPWLCPSEGHKHGVSIQSSINLGDTLLQITREWKTAATWFLARLFIYQSSIVSQILDFFHGMVTILFLITGLVKTENKYKNQITGCLHRLFTTFKVDNYWDWNIFKLTCTWCRVSKNNNGLSQNEIVKWEFTIFTSQSKIDT